MSLVPLADILNHKAAIVWLSDEYAIEPVCFEDTYESGSEDDVAAGCEGSECRAPGCTGESASCRCFSHDTIRNARLFACITHRPAQTTRSTLKHAVHCAEPANCEIPGSLLRRHAMQMVAMAVLPRAGAASCKG